MKIQLGDIIEFNWTFYNKRFIKKGIVKKIYNSEYFDVDCSPSHNAFVSKDKIIKVNGIGI